MSAITVIDDELRLRFPRGEFTDTHIVGLVASRRGSTAGDVRVRAWTEAEIARWYIEKDRFDRIGRRVAWVIRKAGRDPAARGLVQRVAGWRRVPLFDPPKCRCMVVNARVDGLGWLTSTPDAAFEHRLRYEQNGSD